MSRSSAQRGVALVTAMLIMAIVATIATLLALGQQVWLRQTENLSESAQIESLRRSALEFAAILLTQDAKNNKTDHLKEEWAKPVPLPTDNGIIVITVTDAQARFNLNNVVNQSGQPNPKEADLYRRLLEVIGLDRALAEPLIDWIDIDSTAQPGGAEDLEYMNLDPPYRTANRPLKSVDELRLIKGYTDEVVEKLRPYVIALPKTNTDTTPINVNTAPAAVLAALTNLTIAQAEQLERARLANPYNDRNAFVNLLQLPAGSQIGGAYDVATGYFIVVVDVRIGRTERRSEGLIERPAQGAQPATVLWSRQPPLKVVFDENKT